MGDGSSPPAGPPCGVFDPWAGGVRPVQSDRFRPNLVVATVLFGLTSFCGLLLVYGLNTWLPQLMRKAGYDLGDALSFLIVLNLGNLAGFLGYIPSCPTYAGVMGDWLAAASVPHAVIDLDWLRFSRPSPSSGIASAMLSAIDDENRNDSCGTQLMAARSACSRYWSSGWPLQHTLPDCGVSWRISTRSGASRLDSGSSIRNTRGVRTSA